jgi:transposase
MLRIIPKSDADVTELRHLYRTTKDVRIRTRAQMILLAFDGLSAPHIARIVELDPFTVRQYMKRYLPEGIAGLADRPRTGRPRTATPAYVELAMMTLRQRPRALGLPFSVWSLERLSNYLKEKTQITVSDETIRTHVRANGIALSRPQHKGSSPDPDYLVKTKRSRPRVTT